MKRTVTGRCSWCGKQTTAALVTHRSAVPPSRKRTVLKCPRKGLPLYRCDRCNCLRTADEIIGGAR